LPPKPAPRSEPLQQAINQLNQIIVDLREALTDLEDVAELLEIAETQKLDDEREIEALRRTLNQLQRARDRGNLRPNPPAQTLPASGSHRVLPTSH
jgi:chromosome segregation ATPase